jgi:hypothetical protein
MHVGYWREIQKERRHWEDQDEGGRTLLKSILEKSGSGYGPVESSCEHGNEPAGSIKYCVSLEQLRKWRLLKAGSAPCN